MALNDNLVVLKEGNDCVLGDRSPGSGLQERAFLEHASRAKRPNPNFSSSA